MSELTQARLKEVLDYNPEMGVFTWKARANPDLISEIKRWNTRYAGTMAGSVNGLGYRDIIVDRVSRRACRMAWLYMSGVWPDGEMDHIDRDKSNDIWGNLRVATRSQNCANKIARKDNSSGHKGVTWDIKHKSWLAHIGFNYKKINLGRYKNIDDAIKAYKEGSMKYFGEFARST